MQYLNQIYSPKYTCWLILLEIFFGVNVNSVSLIKIKIQNVEYLIYSISSNKHTELVYFPFLSDWK